MLAAAVRTATEELWNAAPYKPLLYNHKKEIGRSGEGKQPRYVPVDGMGLLLSPHALGVAKVVKNAALH